MAIHTTTANLGLERAGLKPMTPGDGSPEDQMIATYGESWASEMLALHPWRFATRDWDPRNHPDYETLFSVTDQHPDWAYEIPLTSVPSLVRILAVYDPADQPIETYAVMVSPGYDNVQTNWALYSNQPVGRIRAVYLNDDYRTLAPLYQSALAWRVAYEAAIIRKSAKQATIQWLFQQYQLTMGQAMAADANQTPEPDRYARNIFSDAKG
ncbi:hypothetical protein [Magnetococcus sp. PR-3]|uniref:hypothetical protein n=1 Tax=Magnetococcus sp. PR-3 TaxID=3120355 RepID=UPI002FCDEE05